jgi:hypothetical protein
MAQAYRKITQHGHPSADGQGHVYEHVLVAERALGKLLPASAHVHHVDDDGLNNANRNLVICQDAAYHKLLHVRTRVVKAGGNPNTEKFCPDCRQVKPVEAFNVRREHKSMGRQSICRDCQKVRWQRRAEGRSA